MTRKDIENQIRQINEDIENAQKTIDFYNPNGIPAGKEGQKNYEIHQQAVREQIALLKRKKALQNKLT